MAVAQGIPPSIAPSYQGVLSQLQNTASLESGRPTLAGTAADVINKQNEYERQKGLLDYKAALEDQLSSKQSERAFANSGGIEVTQPMLEDVEKQAGWDPGTLPTSLVGKRFKSADEFQQFITQPVYRKHMQDSLGTLADQYENEGTTEAKKYATFLRGTANLPIDKLATVFDQVSKHISESTKTQKPVVYADPSSSTGYRWSQPNSEGTYIKGVNDLEAPASAGAGGKGGAKPIPVSERKSAIERNALAGDIQTIFDSYSPGKVGMFDYAATKAEQATGVKSSKKKADFTSAVAALKNRILNLRNGQRITQSEADRLLQEIPNPSSNEIDFTQKMEKFTNEFNSIQSEYHDSLTKSGFTGIPEARTATIPEGWGPNYKSPNIDAGYKTADDVRAAYKAGKLKKEQAVKLLQEGFGLK